MAANQFHQTFALNVQQDVRKSRLLPLRLTRQTGLQEEPASRERRREERHDMAYKKLNIVDLAFQEIGIASYEFDLNPQETNGALRQLDLMMATWNKRGIRIGYPIPSSPGNSDLDDELDIPDNAFEAMYLNLAVRISSGFGKQLTPQTRIAAARSYQELLSSQIYPIEQAFDSTAVPSGAGNKTWRYNQDPFLSKAIPPITTGSDDVLELRGNHDND